MRPQERQEVPRSYAIAAWVFSGVVRTIRADRRVTAVPHYLEDARRT
jgi:hypothetical protein